MEKLMNYDFRPFNKGDLVECISDEQPEFYSQNSTKDDGIKKGDTLFVRSCAHYAKWQFAVSFEGKKLIHSARLFKLVEPENSEESVTPSERLESALKFLETSGDVLQALKIAAGVR